jgi:hypothetical protein
VNIVDAVLAMSLAGLAAQTDCIDADSIDQIHPVENQLQRSHLDFGANHQLSVYSSTQSTWKPSEFLSPPLAGVLSPKTRSRPSDSWVNGKAEISENALVLTMTGNNEAEPPPPGKTTDLGDFDASSPSAPAPKKKKKKKDKEKESKEKVKSKRTSRSKSRKPEDRKSKSGNDPFPVSTIDTSDRGTRQRGAVSDDEDRFDSNPRKLSDDMPRGSEHRRPGTFHNRSGNPTSESAGTMPAIAESKKSNEPSWSRLDAYLARKEAQEAIILDFERFSKRLRLKSEQKRRRELVVEMNRSTRPAHTRMIVHSAPSRDIHDDDDESTTYNNDASSFHNDDDDDTFAVGSVDRNEMVRRVSSISVSPRRPGGRGNVLARYQPSTNVTLPYAPSKIATRRRVDVPSKFAGAVATRSGEGATIPLKPLRAAADPPKYCDKSPERTKAPVAPSLTNSQVDDPIVEGSSSSSSDEIVLPSLAKQSLEETVQHIMTHIESAVAQGFERPRNEQLKLLRKIEQVVSDHIYGTEEASESKEMNSAKHGAASTSESPSNVSRETVPSNKSIVTPSDNLKDRIRAFDQSAAAMTTATRPSPHTPKKAIKLGATRVAPCSPSGAREEPDHSAHSTMTSPRRTTNKPPVAPAGFYTPKAIPTKSLHGETVAAERRASLPMGPPIDWTKEVRLKPTPTGTALKVGTAKR